MSLRPHGRAEVSPTAPTAKGVCDRCGFLYSHSALRWQSDWRGPKLQNLRILVCQSCLDEYQQNGQRTIILPADPVPIMNARPEFYVSDNNPLSALGMNVNLFRLQDGSRIGTMVDAGGINAAFDGNSNKPSFMSAMISVANSSYNNYVGINWSGAPASIVPSSLNSPVLTHTLSNFTITAPNDSTFGSTAYVVQGALVNAGFGSWVTLVSGNPAGTVGEVITGTSSGGRFQFHRVAFYGAATGIAVAQVSFSVSDGSSL